MHVPSADKADALQRVEERVENGAPAAGEGLVAFPFGAVRVFRGPAMPYILPSERQRFDPLIAALSAELQKDGCEPGNLNYVISTLLGKALAANRRYAEANKLMGVLACVSAEFYRVDVAPYEDEKRAQNGEIDRTPVV